MNQTILLNSDLTFDKDKSCWSLSGFYQTQGIMIYIVEARLPRDTHITTNVMFDLEADIEDWLEINEPDDNNEIWL